MWDLCEGKEEPNAMELIETFETLLSEREDLIDQLDKQERVMQQLLAKLKAFRRQNQDYVVLLSQFQHQGKFSEQDKNPCMVAACQHDQDAWSDKQVEHQNKVLKTEIKCMQNQLDEMSKDFKALSVRSKETSPSKEGQNFELSDFVHNLSLELEDDDLDKETKELQKMSALIDDMVKDVISATEARDKVKHEAKMWRDEADSLNKTMLETLTKDNPKVTKDPVDLDSLLLESCNLQQAREESQEAQKIPKRPRFLCRKYSLGSRRKPRSLVTFPQVQATLQVLAKEPNLIPECHKYLQNVALMLLEALKDKERQMRLQSKMYDSSSKKLEHFLFHYGSIHDQDDVPKHLRRSESSPAKVEVEGPKIDFEQPTIAMTSLTNHNFYYPSYELIPEKDKKDDTKDLTNC